MSHNMSFNNTRFSMNHAKSLFTPAVCNLLPQGPDIVRTKHYFSQIHLVRVGSQTDELT